MKSPIEHRKQLRLSKTMTMTHHIVHHINQPMHWERKGKMSRKGRKSV